MASIRSACEQCCVTPPESLEDVLESASGWLSSQASASVSTRELKAKLDISEAALRDQRAENQVLVGRYATAEFNLTATGGRYTRDLTALQTKLDVTEVALRDQRTEQRVLVGRCTTVEEQVTAADGLRTGDSAALLAQLDSLTVDLSDLRQSFLVLQAELEAARERVVHLVDELAHVSQKFAEAVESVTSLRSAVTRQESALLISLAQKAKMEICIRFVERECYDARIRVGEILLCIHKNV